MGFDSAGSFDSEGLNDLWRFDPATGAWTWIAGSETAGHGGVYGTPGTPSTTNVPGGRQEAASWTDSSGNLWLFGGMGMTRRVLSMAMTL
jgi:hypothetical protein